ncbi:MAG: polyprenol monophosphomannose synthase [Bacteroidia bacterium]|jgi:dolichol-phosphate mannosyltransferase|nr:polyprenol monophosphomannose synthase [Bacteroidia bacterium]
MSDSLVIIPTYNERENVDPMIRTIMALPSAFDVLIVDDNSPDGTADIVNKLISEYPNRLFLLSRKAKDGLGRAYIAGFKWALERNYQFIFEMDCDFSHPPQDLIRLKEACLNGYDMAIGSRYCKDGKVKDWPLSRVLMSYFASLYVRAVLWFPVKDTTAGFKCYRREVLQSIDLNSIQFTGYAFQIEMKYAAYKRGFKITEVPIIFKDREKGQSKMSIKIFKEALWGVLKMRFKKYD